MPQSCLVSITGANMSRRFLRSFCSASDVSELREKQPQDPDQSLTTGGLSSLFTADYNEQCGRRENVRIFWVKEEAEKDVYQKVDSAMKVGHQNFKNRHQHMSPDT